VDAAWDAGCLEMNTLFPHDSPLLNIEQVHDGEYHAARATAVTGEPMITVVNCEDEPIRIPGSIQRHGFMLLLDRREEHVVAASENAEGFLALPLKLILGASVDTILEREVLAALRAGIRSNEAGSLLTFLGSFKMRDELYSVVTHRVGDIRVLEFERLDHLVSPELMNSVITNFVATLSKLNGETELLQAITRQVKDLTGFDRVLLYRFDQAGHGTVLAEENNGTLPSYLDLRFPASDIPQQARELYVLNTVRIIPDAAYLPSPLRATTQRTVEGLDLSMSLLRSVSPIHLEYMRNMGTLASMSISIVCEGKLWGLISGHHAKPHSVPYLVRSACDLLTRIVASQLMAFRTASKLEKMMHFHGVQRRMLTHMAAENDYVAAIASQMSYLAQVTDGGGAALIIDGHCEMHGQTPPEQVIHRLAAWMDAQPELMLFESRHLKREIEWADEISDVASGLLAIRISDVRQSYLMWFRPEVVSTVNWAGEPITLSDGQSNTDREKSLHPRESFRIWKEMVRGRSAPWTEMEIESAREFRNALVTISLKRAEEAVELSEARFRQLTHALPSPVWTSDDDGRLTYVNQKWRDQRLGEQGKWYENVGLGPEEETRCGQLWQTAVAAGATFEAELQFHAGSEDVERWNLVRSIPFLRGDNTRAGWVGTCTDLTDRRDREAALRMAEKLALTGRMTSVIAHEINNPLEAITNVLYLMRQEVQGNASARNYLEMAQYEIERISGITKQTLRWSKDSIQQAEFATAGDLFDDVVRLFAAKIRNRQITVTIAGGASLRFHGVVGQIRQVMANLVSNALDAVSVGGRVWLDATKGKDGLEIIVRDEGEGMSEETQRQLFHPFFSTKGDLGNGLGLYISNEIVERHGGRLAVESTLGIGTTMRISLPDVAAEKLTSVH
jgi:light-regulated signal transduction histidine kinase (bacteriophytochrome)